MTQKRGLSIGCEKDRVIIDFPGRGSELILSPDQAVAFAAELERQATFCEVWVTAGGQYTVLTGGERGAAVRAWDGKINICFDGPTERESIPYKHARQLASIIRSKIPEAINHLTIVWSPSWSASSLQLPGS